MTSSSVALAPASSRLGRLRRPRSDEKVLLLRGVRGMRLVLCPDFYMNAEVDSEVERAFAEAARLFRSFLTEQSDPDGFYSTIAEDTVALVRRLAQQADVLITGGTIYDGSEAKPFTGDVVITGCSNGEGRPTAGPYGLGPFNLQRNATPRSSRCVSIPLLEGGRAPHRRPRHAPVTKLNQCPIQSKRSKCLYLWLYEAERRVLRLARLTPAAGR